MAFHFKVKDATSFESSATIPEADAEELDNLSIDTQLSLQDQRYKEDTRHRSTLVYWVMWMSACWVVVMLVIVILSGCSLLELTDVVLTTLLATTTTTVLGLPLVVLRGLFGYNK